MKTVQVLVYVFSGMCAAVAGLILDSQLTSAGPTAGTSYELTAIAAVVVGGAALTGGRGNIRGTLLGAFVIGFLSDGLVIIAYRPTGRRSSPAGSSCSRCCSMPFSIAVV